MLEDHLPCPALSRWLPERLPGPVAVWVCPDARPGGALRRLISRLTTAASDEGPLGSLVVLGSLRAAPPQLPDVLVSRVVVGGIVVELAPAASSWLSTLWRRGHQRRQAMLAAAERVRHWSSYGLVELEQWVALEPPDTLVTLGLHGRALGQNP